MMERVIVIIDGSNLYHKLKNLGINNISSYNYSSLINFLVGNRNIITKTYYVGTIRTKEDDPKSYILMKKQHIFFYHLQKQGIFIEKGFLLSDKKGRYHEKGVDVKMAVDLLIGAYEDTYDTAILISSDTDLIPAIKKILEKGKKLEYIGFQNQPSKAIRRHATITKLLTKDDIVGFAAKGK